MEIKTSMKTWFPSCWFWPDAFSLLRSCNHPSKMLSISCPATFIFFLYPPMSNTSKNGTKSDTTNAPNSSKKSLTAFRDRMPSLWLSGNLFPESILSTTLSIMLPNHPDNSIFTMSEPSLSLFFSQVSYISFMDALTSETLTCSIISTLR
ncbi:hypothetical protein HanIR_Chr09g0436961 [Helianthus annuus]|nr:hypothetical protein HanIR_Chr09g0436961 [Helianthus annuus]